MRNCDNTKLRGYITFTSTQRKDQYENLLNNIQAKLGVGVHDKRGDIIIDALTILYDQIKGVNNE